MNTNIMIPQEMLNDTIEALNDLWVRCEQDVARLAPIPGGHYLAEKRLKQAQRARELADFFKSR